MTYSIYAWCQMIVLCSFLGFIVENVWLLLTKSYIDNRNMNLPFLLGYGLAIRAIALVLGLPNSDNLVVYFLELVLVVSLGEILLGTTVEKLCGFSYWDYTRLPFHLTKYTSLFTSIGFALIIEIFMFNFFTPAMVLIERLMTPGIALVSVLMVSILCLDFFFSFRHMHHEHVLYRKWVITNKNHRPELRIVEKENK